MGYKAGPVMDTWGNTLLEPELGLLLLLILMDGYNTCSTVHVSVGKFPRIPFSRKAKSFGDTPMHSGLDKSMKELSSSNYSPT